MASYVASHSCDLEFDVGGPRADYVTFNLTACVQRNIEGRPFVVSFERFRNSLRKERPRE